ncbi:MAG: hypothetical protein ABI548_12525 [Polyangiaceae bacterium]
MSERAIHFGVLIAGIALTTWAFTRPEPKAQLGAQNENASPARAGAVSPLAIIPSGSAFVLSADVAALERAPLGAAFAQRLGQLGRTNELAARCGFDPLTRLSQLALAVPSAGMPGSDDAHADDFGIVASGPFSAAEITRCASAAIAQRGGDAAFSKLGGFSSVRDRKGSGGEVAAKNGLLIVSGGSYFRELLDSAEGSHAKPDHDDARDARHAELRRALGPGQLIATWLLADGWFQRVSGDDSARLSPLGALKALGARVQVGTDVRLAVLLDCADADGTARLAALLDERLPSLAMLGLAPALMAAAQRVEVTRAGARLQLTLTLAPNELRALFDALFSAETRAAKR